MVVTELAYACHRVSISVSLTFYMVVAELFYILLGTYLSGSWYMFVAKLVYVCHRLCLWLSPN